jgi:4-hydroxy-3-polyprenylbenzoate decarboxylase
MKEIVVGVTGASGSLCARDLLRGLLSVPEVTRIHAIVSRFARQTMHAELGVPEAGDEALLRQALCPEGERRVVFHDPENMAAPISSGSYPAGGMVVVPCSMGTLGAIASGVSSNLIHRAADVTLKERRPLVLALRETPLSRIHLRNMLAVCEAGAVLFPLVPAFYARPTGIDQILEQYTARILDQLRLPHHLGRRWGA